MTQTPAGWFPDRQQPGKLRWWDGQQWTTHTMDTANEPTVPLGVSPTPSGEPAGTVPYQPTPLVGAGGPPGQQPGKPWWQQTWVLVAGGVVVGLLIGTALGAAGDQTTAVSASSQPTKTITADPTTTATVTVTETAEPTEVAAPSDKPTPSPTSTKSKPPAQGTGTKGWVMPDETGIDLQSAQDDLQTISGNPLYISFSEDATGAGRGQWLDSGWQVCWSKPTPGTTVTNSMDVTFYVVRISETCP